MSKYTTYYKSRQLEYRSLGINWAIFAEEHKLTEEQLRGMKLFFRPIARRFGLTVDYQKLGII